MYTHVFLYVHRCVFMMYRSYRIYTRTARVSPVVAPRGSSRSPQSWATDPGSRPGFFRDRPEVRTMDPDVMWEKQCHKCSSHQHFSILIGGMFTIPKWVVYNIV